MPLPVKLQRAVARITSAARRNAQKQVRAEHLQKLWSSAGAQVFDRWLRTIQSVRTQLAYRAHLSDWLDWLARNNGGDPLMVAATQLTRYYQELSERKPTRRARPTLSVATRQARVAALRKAYQYAVEEHYLTSSPAAHLRIKGRSRPTTSALNASEIERLLACCDRTTMIGRRDYAIIMLFLHTGLRRTEMAALRWGNIRRESNPWLIEFAGKGEVERLIPIGANAVQALSEWQALVQLPQRLNDPVWVEIPYRVIGDSARQLNCGESQLSDQPLSSDAIYLMLKRRGKKIGITQLTPHMLRRTYCTNLIRRGCSLDLVQRLMGHSSIAATQLYIKRDRQELIDAVKFSRYDQD